MPGGRQALHEALETPQPSREEPPCLPSPYPSPATVAQTSAGAIPSAGGLLSTEVGSPTLAGSPGKGGAVLVQGQLSPAAVAQHERM